METTKQMKQKMTFELKAGRLGIGVGGLNGISLLSIIGLLRSRLLRSVGGMLIDGLGRNRLDGNGLRSVGGRLINRLLGRVDR